MTVVSRPLKFCTATTAWRPSGASTPVGGSSTGTFVPSAALGQGTAKLTATSSTPVTSLASVTVQRMRLGSAAGACEMPRAVGQLTSTAWA